MAREKEVKLVRHPPASGSVNEGENVPEKIVKDREIRIQGSAQDENKDLTIYIEEGELIAVEAKEIYKFHLGPGNENLTLQIDKDLLINIQGGDVRVVELRQKFRIPVGSARQDQNPAQQIKKEDRDIYIPGEPMKEELKEHPLGLGSSKGENLAQQLHEIPIPAGGSGKSTDATPAMMFYLPSDDDSEECMPSEGPKKKVQRLSMD